METYYLTSEKEIRNMLKGSFMIDEVESYVKSLTTYFWKKANDFLEVLIAKDKNLSTEKVELKCQKKYKITCVSPLDVKRALENYLIAKNHLENFAKIVKKIINEELEHPTFVAVGSLDKESDLTEAQIDLYLEFWDKYVERIMPYNVYRLYNESYGYKFNDVLSDFISYYEAEEED